MPTTTTTTTGSSTSNQVQDQTQYGNQSQTGYQSSQLTAAAETPLERVLREIAGAIYQQQAGESVAPGAYGGVTAEGVMAGGVTDAQRAMVGDWQNSTLAASRAGMQGVMDETMGSISNQMADRGILDSSAYGAAAGSAQRDLMRQYGAMAANTQAQAAQQLMGFSSQNQSVGMNLLQMRDQARQWAANPQLLRDLMDYRLRTGAQVGTSFSQGANFGGSSSYGTNTTTSTETSKQKKGTDWAALFGAIGLAAGGVIAAPFTGGASLAALPAAGSLYESAGGGQA